MPFLTVLLRLRIWAKSVQASFLLSILFVKRSVESYSKPGIHEVDQVQEQAGGQRNENEQDVENQQQHQIKAVLVAGLAFQRLRNSHGQKNAQGHKEHQHHHPGNRIGKDSFQKRQAALIRLPVDHLVHKHQDAEVDGANEGNHLNGDQHDVVPDGRFARRGEYFPLYLPDQVIDPFHDYLRGCLVVDLLGQQLLEFVAGLEQVNQPAGTLELVLLFHKTDDQRNEQTQKWSKGQ